jgi:glutamine phosphoribosylpyrophosphate amidotransferase
VLCQRLSELLRKAKKEGYAKCGNFEAVLLHLRYATGGATHWHNAQPHWYEYYDNLMYHQQFSLWR